jgi:predicted PurR-regulated permease PerM
MNSNWSPPTRYFVLGIILVFLAFVCWEIREIFKPLTIAAIIAYIFYPVTETLHKHTRIPRKVVSNLVYFLSLALIIAIPVLFAPTLFAESKEVGTALLTKLDEIGLFLNQPVSFAGLALHFDTLVPNIKTSLENLLGSLPANMMKVLATTSRGSLWFLVVVISVYYFMTDWEKIREGIIHLAPAEYQHDMRRLYLEIKTVWMSYLRGQLTLMAIVGVVFSIVWSVIGLPGALLLGVIGGLFSIIPDVGPFAATILALIVALLEGSNASWMPANHFLFGLVVIGLYVLLINIKNIWLRPLILGRSVHMHEGLVFVAIIAAVVFTGITGAFIVIPVLASLAVVGKYLRARLLGLPAFAEEEPAADSEPQTASDSNPKTKKASAKKRKSA